MYQYNPNSPTQTDILGPVEPWLNVISREFVLDKWLLKNDYLKPEYANRRKQFFRQYNELERDYLRDEYYKRVTDLERHLNCYHLFAITSYQPLW